MTSSMWCSIIRIVRSYFFLICMMNSAELFGLLRVHAGGRLVEQEQLRVGRKRAGDLQPPLQAVRQRRGEIVAILRKVLLFKQLHRLLLACAGPPPR